MRLVFVHGWALGPEIWDALASRLSEYAQARVNLGYFGAADIPTLQESDILVGHSAGLLWGLREKRDWAGVVSINSFARFCLDAQGRGCVRPAALRAMRLSLERDPQDCADAFRRSLGIAPASGSAQKEHLMEGLDLLGGFDATSSLDRRPCLVLGAEDDFLAPPAAARDLAAQSGGALALSATGGHGLPWTAPDFCAARIGEFLRAHEF
ncbi:alpha/beta hydrolase [Rhodoblastus sp.]|uniref:alpha/beta fold hydrolase n=1 Tax=Rhodoblastus sp. TaxID=1962975 RepID=UPI002600DC52|nr:alpha/beta hydrolase [Rhodoblastus sp.]